MRDAYSYQSKIVELNEVIRGREHEISKLKQKSEHLVNSCMKIYNYLNLNENFDSKSHYEFEVNKIKQTSSPHSGALSVFESSEFYKNEFFNLVKDKIETKVKDITEKLAYSESQRDQLATILEKRSKEISSCLSENNRLQNVIEMQKVTITELQKDFENATINAYSHPTSIKDNYQLLSPKNIVDK